MATALTSALTKIPVRRDVAMTGEITLRGKVLPIGGVKEKVLAAHRAGVKNIVLPRDNEKDLADIPKNVLDTLDLHLVSTMDEVLKIALVEPLPARIAPAPVVTEVADAGDKRPH
jgi:ATP-dependent Lon protease